MSKKEQIGIGRRDFFMVPPNMIEIQEGFNARKDLGREDGSFDELKNSIREIGVQVPLMVSKKGWKKNDPESKLKLIAGERRLTAVLELIKEGCQIERIPCMPVGREYSQIDEVLLMVTENAQKPLLAHEEGEAYKRLVRYGLTEAEISKKVGKSITHIKNRIAIVGNPTIVESLKNGDISVSEASMITRIEDKDGQDEAVKEIAQVRKDTKSNGKKRVSSKKKKEIVESKRKKNGKSKKEESKPVSQKKDSNPAPKTDDEQDSKPLIKKSSINRKQLLAKREELIEKFDDLNPSHEEEIAFLRGQITCIDWFLGDDKELKQFSLKMCDENLI